MKPFIYIFIGSGLGGISRYGIGRWMQSYVTTNFPFSTLVVNVLACFSLGLIIGIAGSRQIFSENGVLFWTIGFCGGFSTFSTFSSESLVLCQNGHYLYASLYILASVLLCLAATLGGVALGGLAQQ